MIAPPSARSAADQAFGLLAWSLVTFAAAGAGAAASADAGPFYAELVRPSWAPPGWTFAPVWTFLYAAMAIAAWLVWRARGFAAAAPALTLFVVQLAGNALWTWLFFRWRLGAAAAVEIMALWCLIAATMVAFHRIQRVAAALLVPYLAWVTFAAALTVAVWRLNPDVL